VKSGLTTADNSFHQDTEMSQYAEEIAAIIIDNGSGMCKGV
jgi:hypothetical protein